MQRKARRAQARFGLFFSSPRRVTRQGEGCGQDNRRRRARRRSTAPKAGAERPPANLRRCGVWTRGPVPHVRHRCDRSRGKAVETALASAIHPSRQRRSRAAFDSRRRGPRRPRLRPTPQHSRRGWIRRPPTIQSRCDSERGRSPLARRRHPPGKRPASRRRQQDCPTRPPQDRRCTQTRRKCFGAFSRATHHTRNTRRSGLDAQIFLMKLSFRNGAQQYGSRHVRRRVVECAGDSGKLRFATP